MALTQAWYGAALSRHKRLPSLQHLLHPPQTRTLTPDEAVKRKAEFEELKARLGGVATHHAGSRARKRVRPDPR